MNVQTSVCQTCTNMNIEEIKGVPQKEKEKKNKKNRIECKKDSQSNLIMNNYETTYLDNPMLSICRMYAVNTVPTDNLHVLLFLFIYLFNFFAFSCS